MGDTGDIGADRSGWKWLWGVQMDPNRLDMGERLRVPEKYGCGRRREREMILAVEHLFLRDRSWFVYSGAKEAVFPVLYFHDIF